MPPTKVPWLRYEALFKGGRAAVAAVLAGVGAALVVWSLHVGFPKDGFLFLYMPVISGIAYLGGRGPGLATVLVSFFTAWYFVIPPPYSFAVRADTLPILALFAAGGLLALEWAVHLRRIALASRRLARIVESSDDPILGIDADGTIRTWNASAERLYGYRAEEATGRSLSMLVPPDRRGEIDEIVARVQQGKAVEGYETVRIADDGTIVHVSLSLSPVPDESGRIVGAAVIARDITERKRTLARVSLLYETTAALSVALTPEAVAEVGVDQALRALGAKAGSLSLLSEDGRALEIVRAVGYPQDFILRWRRAPVAERAGAAAAVRSREPQFFRSREALAALYAGGALPGSTLPESGARAVIPLLAGRQVIGILSLVFPAPRDFDDDDREFIVALARQCAQALERARLYQREHAAAATLQRALLPSALPAIPGLGIDAAYVAGGREADVGGDWYDAFQLPDGRVVLCVGDVIGRGLRAATVMGQLRHTIRAVALDGHAPSAALHRAHQVLRHTFGSEALATAVLAILQPADSTLTYSTAGHPPPIVAMEDGGVKWLSNGWVPLGAHYPGQPPEHMVRLAPGDLVVFYTDGLTEETRDVIKGEERLLAAAREEQARRSESPARAILHRVLGTVVPKDDVAVLTLALASVPGRRIEMTVLATAEAPARIRHAFRRAAPAFGVHGERAFSLQVALGEAVTNAVEHAYGLEPGPVSVRMWCENGVLTMEVEDRGRWRPERDQGRGRGTAIMRALVDHLEIDHRHGGTLVRLMTQLDREAGALPGTAAVSAPLIPPIPRRPEDASVQRRD